MPYIASVLQDYVLAFKSVANIIPFPKKGVPVGIYYITQACETSLDHFESFPNLYTKKYIKISVADEVILVMTYVMNKEYGFGIPSDAYYRVIAEGYNDWGLDNAILLEAREYAKQHDDGKAFRSKRWDEVK